MADEIDEEAAAPGTEDFAAECARLVKEIPDFEGQSYYRQSECAVGIIADEEDRALFEGTARLVPLAPDVDGAALADLDLVLCVSCRDGGGFGGDAGRGRAAEILRGARAAGVPTAFWSTMDPAGFEDFLPVAAEADLVFSVDEDKLDEYRSRLGKTEVFRLDWCVNPAQHNPIGFLKRLSGRMGAFARNAFYEGSWREGDERFEKGARRIFDGVRDAEGHRLFIADAGGDAFPEDYAEDVVDPLPQGTLRKAEKLFHFAVVVNEAPESRSACSRRIYEAQAEGTLVLSSYSRAVSNDFPGLFTISDSGEVGRIMDGYREDELAAMEIEGARRMYSGNTAFDRMGEILSRAGLGEAFGERPVNIIVDEADKEAQTFLRVQRCPGARLVEAKDAADLEEGFAIRLSAPYPERPWYLIDLVNAFKYCDAAWTAYTDSPEEGCDWAEGSAPEGPVMVDLAKVPAAALLAGELPKDARGFLLALQHWGRDTAATPKDLAVVMPVYNNSSFLWGRSFRSLLRSSVFDRMQIYLVDDGSTDGYSELLVSQIAQIYDNVTAYLFDAGGSGSASRPRNKGVELADEDWVTFLDPDNEAIGDGYAQLLEDAQKLGVDLAYGGWLKVEAGGRVKHLRFGRGGDRRIDAPADELVAANFDMLNPQSSVIRRELFVQARLSFLEGATAEDTLLGYEIMLNAASAQRRRLPASVYWADREDSLTNAVRADYFDKTLRAHERQAQVLKRYGLVGEYRARRLGGYLENWLIPTLAKVEGEERPAATKTLVRIVAMYEELYFEEEREEGERKELEAITAARAESQKDQEALERMRSSASWKIGRAVTWLPRKIRDLFKGGSGGRKGD